MTDQGTHKSDHKHIMLEINYECFWLVSLVMPNVLRKNLILGI